MNQFIQKIPAIVLQIAKEEDEILKKFGKGIFFIPELAFSYKLGKELGKVGHKHYNDFKWNREVKIGKEGPSDLVFDINNEKVVIEVKMISMFDKYKKDIDKLKQIDDKNIRKIFIALIDTYRGEEELDYKIIEMNKLNLKPLKMPFDQIKSKYSPHNKPVSCIISIWEVK